MPFTELLIKGANASVVVFVVSSTLSVGLGLTVPQILEPLRNGRLVVLSLLANFVLAPRTREGCSPWARLSAIPLRHWSSPARTSATRRWS
jgi:predicted Na+-dependent transporter